MNQAIKYSSVYHFADDTNLLHSDTNPKTLKKSLNKYKGPKGPEAKPPDKYLKRRYNGFEF